MKPNGDKLYALIYASVGGKPINISGYPAFTVSTGYYSVELQNGTYVKEPASAGMYVVIDAPENAWHIPSDVKNVDAATSDWLYGMTRLIKRPY